MPDSTTASIDSADPHLQSSELQWTEADDSLHAVGNSALDWTETIWFSFNVPERSLAGWLYTQMRPNLGTVSGGAFVYDPTAVNPWDIPYYAYQHHQALPDPLDITDVSFDTGVRVKMIEPGMKYELGYKFRNQTDFTADLQFAGLTQPVPHVQGAPPFVGSSHYDQHGRVTGTLKLRGETIEVNSVAVRDRSWGRRPELLGRVHRLSYAFGHVESSDEAFLAFCVPPKTDHSSLSEDFVSGYLVRDGLLRRLVSGQRETVRRKSGAVERIELDCLDSDSRRLQVAGTVRSQMFLPTAHLCINSLLEWETPSGVGFGEDQDVWSMTSFADLKQPR